MSIQMNVLYMFPLTSSYQLLSLGTDGLCLLLLFKYGGTAAKDKQVFFQ